MVLALLVSACSEAGDGIRQQSQAIVNGAPSGAEDDAVVLLTHFGAAGLDDCTATLVAPNLVLTARHCVARTADAPFTCDAAGNGSAGGAVFEDVDPRTLLVVTGATRRATAGDFDARGKAIFHDDATNLCAHDLALVVLDRTIPNARVAAIRLRAPAWVGETIDAVGWGATTTTDAPPVRQARSGVAVVAVGPDANAAGGPVAPNELAVGEATCKGDSGGPALDARTRAVIGVLSRGGSGDGCLGARNTHTATAPFAGVIEAAFAAAGATPLDEGDAGVPADSRAEDDAGPSVTHAAGGCGVAQRPRPGDAAPGMTALAILGMVAHRRRCRST